MLWQQTSFLKDEDFKKKQVIFHLAEAKETISLALIQ